MQRREFITLLGGAAAWSVAARAEAKVFKIGVMAVARLSPETRPAYDAFFAELRSQGFVEGDNLVAIIRWIDEDDGAPYSRHRVRAGKGGRDRGRGKRDWFEGSGRAAPNVPTIMYANNYDPIDRGYVNSLRSPGGNITGVFTRQPEWPRSRSSC